MSETHSHAPEMAEIMGAPAVGTRTNMEQPFPSCQIIACGGCATNIIKSFLKEGKRFDEKVGIKVIDTSLSNVNGLDTAVEFLPINGLGSGKDRAKNFNAIKEYLDTNNQLTKEASDISVLVFATGGGSGSIIGPLLAQKILHNTKKGVLLVGVLDASSERDCINTINTLKTLSGLAKEYNLYFPIILFDNSNAGRFKVNKAASMRIGQFLDLMTSREIEEFDYTDRMNFVRPTAMDCPSGLYLFSIISGDEASEGEVNVKMKPNSQVHAVVSVDDTGAPVKVLSTVSYFGYSEAKRYVAVNGLSIPDELLQSLKESHERYRDAVGAKDDTENKLAADKEHQPNAGITL